MMRKVIKLIITLGFLLSTTSIVQAQLAKCKGKFLGNIMPNSWGGATVIRSDFATYWNQVTPENAGKWGVAEGSRDRFSWGDMDLMYNFCQQNGFPFKQHVFVWGAQQPEWIGALSHQEQREEVEEWYAAFAQRYPNTAIIDVVNESLPGHAPDVTFRDALGGFNNGAGNPYLAAHPEYGPYGTGWDYIIYSFAKAREYFPDATLLLNDYNIINNVSNINKHLEIVNILKARGLIDGVGIQCHAFSVDNMTARQITDNLNRLASAGLPIHVTELDIRGDNNNEQQQRDRYSRIFPAFWEHPSVAGITLWGYIEGTTWMNYTGILNADGSKRMAMTWLEQYMASRPDVCSSNPVVEFTSPVNNTGFVSPGPVKLEVTATNPNGSITNVRFYNGTTLLNTDNTAPYSYDWTNVAPGTYEIRAVATDNEGKTGEAKITIRVNVPQSPYGGVAHRIPGTIQLEEFDLGGNGFAYFDATPGSEVSPVVNFRTDEDVDIETCTDVGGGYNIGYATAGEWLEYTVNVEASGTYDLELRVAVSGTGRTLTVAMNGENIASNVSIPNTNGWQTWQTVTVRDVALTAGTKVMRVTIGATDYVNLNYVTFKAVNVSLPPVVNLTGPSNNASYGSNETVRFTANASDPDGSITKVDFYAGDLLIGSTTSAPYSVDWFRMNPGVYVLTAVATDDKGISTTSSPVSVTIRVVQAPFNGVAHLIPGRIEAEEYDLGGEGLGYHEANTNGNQGGAPFRNDEVDIERTGDSEGEYNIAYILEGEWLAYTVEVMSSGVYDLNLRMAAEGAGKTLHIEIDGVNVTGPVQVPNTGGWQTWETFTVSDVSLSAGEHVMRIVFGSSYMNLNYVEFVDVVTGMSASGMSAIEVYPVPFSAAGFTIKSPGLFTYRITDLSGSIVETGKGTDALLTGQNLASGVYMLSIENSQGITNKKILKY